MKGISASFLTTTLVSLALRREVWKLGGGIAEESERETSIKEKVKWKRGRKRKEEKGERGKKHRRKRCEKIRNQCMY